MLLALCLPRGRRIVLHIVVHHMCVEIFATSRLLSLLLLQFKVPVCSLEFENVDQLGERASKRK